MFGTTFCQMENRLLMSLTALLILGIREGIAYMTTSNQTETSSTQPNNSFSTIPTATCAPCPKTKNSTTQLVLGQVKVERKSPCEGLVYVDFPEKPLCWSTFTTKKWLSELCRNMRCGDFIGHTTKPKSDGYEITSNMILNNTMCNGLHISCRDALGKELAAYKAVTGILIVFILVVIFVQFSRPTYKAMRKRFSQKRQSRWIGPTQSQSVSYHRGQGGPNNNTVKRQSYPGLERLTVSTSREPSSNRNSDYDSYGYN